MKDAVLYTGTFDPFHLGHFWQLQRTYRAHPFEKAVVAVIRENPKKPNATAWQKRIELVKLRINASDLPFEVEVHPIDYVTPETLTAFVDKYLSDYKVTRTIASDVMVEFAKDEEFNFNDALLLFHYAIVVRPLVGKEAVEKAIAQLPPKVAKGFSYEIVYVQTEDDISATNIRKNIEAAASKGFITPEQLTYIHREKLYGLS